MTMQNVLKRSAIVIHYFSYHLFAKIVPRRNLQCTKGCSLSQIDQKTSVSFTVCMNGSTRKRKK